MYNKDLYVLVYFNKIYMTKIKFLYILKKLFCFDKKAINITPEMSLHHFLFNLTLKEVK